MLLEFSPMVHVRTYLPLQNRQIKVTKEGVKYTILHDRIINPCQVNGGAAIAEGSTGWSTEVICNPSHDLQYWGDYVWLPISGLCMETDYGDHFGL